MIQDAGKKALRGARFCSKHSDAVVKLFRSTQRRSVLDVQVERAIWVPEPPPPLLRAPEFPRMRENERRKKELEKKMAKKKKR